MMVVNHLGMQPTWTRPFTWGGRLWFTAAEGFILISGIIFGQVYQQRLADWGWRQLVEHVLSRAGKLFGLVVAATILFSLGDYLLRALWGRASDQPASLLLLLINPVFGLASGPTHVNLLYLYALLLPFGLLALYLLAQGKWPWVLGGSFLLWLGWKLDPASFVIFRTKFQFAGWQIYFIAGLVAGYHRQHLQRIWRGLPWAGSLLPLGIILPICALLLLNYQVTYKFWEYPAILHPFSSAMDLRFEIHFSRYIFTLLTLAAIFFFVDMTWKLWQQGLGWLLLPLGQNSLLAYLLHACFVYLITRLPDYPFPNLARWIPGFIQIGVLLMVWEAVRRLRAPFRSWLQRALF
jgi:hypothetical protein